MNLSQQIADNYHRVNDRLGKAAHFAGRNFDDIKLIVVTKARPIEVVRAVVASGARYIGENYPAEGANKIAMVANDSIEWHMIGHIQSRKAKIVSSNYAWVHSIDRIKIANQINQRSSENNRIMPVLLECNVSGEISKYGWQAWDENRWLELVETLAPLFDLDYIQVRGLMTVPPLTSDLEVARKYFQRLRRLKSFLQTQFPQAGLDHLSMGMSNDFEIAVQEGATMIRVGSAIVGRRR